MIKIFFVYISALSFSSCTNFVILSRRRCERFITVVTLKKPNKPKADLMKLFNRFDCNVATVSEQKSYP